MKEMKVNLRRNTMDKEKRPQTVLMNSTNVSTADEFRSYITNLETLLRDTLNENLKLRQQVSELSGKKNQIDFKKLQTKVDELSKKYSKGKTYLTDLEKRMNGTRSINQNLKELNKNMILSNDNSNDSKIQNIISKYESQIEAIMEKQTHIENKLNSSEKEKDDLKNKFNDEFVLMSSVIYNLGFLYWSMKSDYEDKLKQNKGWLEMERIKQYNGDY
jgi:predicted  nucleic acid-binding Zn-ribbon protein